MSGPSKGPDPRAAQGVDGTGSHDLMVSAARNSIRPVLAVAFLVSVAGILLFGLNASRSAVAPERVQQFVVPPPAPPPLDIPKPAPPVEAVKPAPVMMAMVRPGPAPAPLVPDDSSQRLHAPAVVVDMQAGAADRPPPNLDVAISAPGATPLALGAKPASDLGTAALAAAAMAGAPATKDSAKEGAAHDGNPALKFAARVAQQSSDVSVATQMANLKTTIIQGSTIQALLETAINSDLPGYARAIVRRDVLGFDGKAVLIPRGSRVIGQYRNAMSLGESRVFVLWTRIIRPDGVSVEISSPGADALGEGGMTGEVSTHFFERFSGAILMSVLNAGVNAVSGTPAAEIAIGSPAAAIGAAATATVPAGGTIPPTIKVEQGSPVTIFVARDLDFSAVKPVQ